MTEPIDPNQLSFSDMPEPDPVPNYQASESFPESEPPGPSRTPGGFRAFAQRSATKAPRAKRETKKTPPMAIAAIPNRKGQFVEPLMKMYGTAGAVVMMYDPICGTAVMTSAQKCAETMDELAYQNEAVRRVVWSMTRTSTFGAVIVAHLPIIMAVVMHHVPAAQEAFGAMGANMMEEFLKQSTPDVPND
jgi:hypothetical protein